MLSESEAFKISEMDTTHTSLYNQEEKASSNYFYLNFASEQSKVLSQRWIKLHQDKKTFYVTLEIQNYLEANLYDFMLTHQNSRTYHQCKRRFFKPILAKSKSKQQPEVVVVKKWPVFNHDPLQKEAKWWNQFSIQFCLKKSKLPLSSFVRPILSTSALDESLVTIDSLKIHNLSESSYVIFSLHENDEQINRKLWASVVSDPREQNIEDRLIQELVLKSQFQQSQKAKQKQIREYIYHKNVASSVRNIIKAHGEIYNLKQEEKNRTAFKDYQLGQEDLKGFKSTQVGQLQGTASQTGKHAKNRQNNNYYIKQSLKSKKSFLIGPLDQVLVKASYLLNLLIVFQSRKYNHFCVMLNINGQELPVEVDFKVQECQNYQHYTNQAYIGGSPPTDPKQKTDLLLNIHRAILFEKSFIKLCKHSKILEGLPHQILMVLTNCPTHYYQAKQHRIYLEFMCRWTAEKRQFNFKPSKSSMANTINQYKRNLETHLIIISLPKKNKHTKQIQNNFAQIYINSLQYVPGAQFDDIHKIKNQPMSEQEKKVFQEMLDSFINKLVGLTFSFRGLYIIDSDSQKIQPLLKLSSEKDLTNNLISDPQKIIVKLAATQGEDIAREARQRWKYAHKTLKYEQFCYQNQLFLTLKELELMEGLIGICIIKEIKNENYKDPEQIQQIKYPYKQLPICMQKNNWRNFRINIMQPSLCTIVLHQELLKVSQGYNQVYYPSTLRLQSIRQGPSSSLSSNAANSTEIIQSHQSDVALNIHSMKCCMMPGNHLLRVQLQQPDVSFCVLSLQSISEDDILESIQTQVQKGPQQIHEQYDQKYTAYQELNKQWIKPLQELKQDQLNIRWKFSMDGPLQDKENKLSTFPKDLLKVALYSPRVQMKFLPNPDRQSVNVRKIQGVYSFKIEAQKQESMRYKCYLMSVMVRKAALKEFAQNGDYDFKYDISYGALSKEEDYDIFT